MSKESKEAESVLQPSRRGFIKFLGATVAAAAVSTLRPRDAAAACTKCDCDPDEPASTKASFALGKIAAGI